MKDINGRLLRGNEVRKRRTEYFEEFLNVAYRKIERQI